MFTKGGSVEVQEEDLKRLKKYFYKDLIEKDFSFFIETNFKFS